MATLRAVEPLFNLGLVGAICLVALVVITVAVREMLAERRERRRYYYRTRGNP